MSENHYMISEVWNLTQLHLMIWFYYIMQYATVSFCQVQILFLPPTIQ